MNKAFEMILDRLEEAKNSEYLNGVKRFNKKERIAFDNAKEIVQEVAEEFATDTNVGTNGWIACSERLPEENKDGWTHLILSIKTGEVIFGFWHNEEMGFCKHFRDGVCRVCGVIAWMPLPEPFKERDSD